MKTLLLSPLLALALSLLLPSLLGANLERRSLEVDGVKREYLYHRPSTGERPPLVFASHGHGGQAHSAARQFRIHEVWPEAAVVYLQGLKTPGRLTDPEGKKTGWQNGIGDHAPELIVAFFKETLAAAASTEARTQQGDRAPDRSSLKAAWIRDKTAASTR